MVKEGKAAKRCKFRKPDGTFKVLKQKKKNNRSRLDVRLQMFAWIIQKKKQGTQHRSH